MPANRNPVIPAPGKSTAQMLQERRGQALETDSAMQKLAPPDLDLNPPKAHPLEAAFPFMVQIQSELEQLVEVSRRVYDKIEELKNTGDAKGFLDPSLGQNPEAWEKKAKELSSLKNKLLTTLPMLSS